MKDKNNMIPAIIDFPDTASSWMQIHGNRNSSLIRFRRQAYQIWKIWSWKTVTGLARFLKRTIDIVASATAIILLFPLLAGVAAAIKKYDKGPIFYFQSRTGQWGKEFLFPKFRSMVVDSDKIRKQILQQNDDGSSVRFKMKHDPRVTPIGRFIRKFSIDELPQLWSVLKGDMTLVGPRPPLPSEVAEYTLADRRRLDVVPGLTCFWQVMGRSEIPFNEQVQLDVRYIDSHNVWLDIKLLFKTVPAVLFGKGAY